MPKQITELNFEMLYSAECLIEPFQGIIADIKENQEGWHNWATCLDPQDTRLPGDWEDTLTDFQKSILLKVFRNEKLMFAFKNYVKLHMGTYYTEGKPTTMEMMYADMDQITPLIFILQVGADPTDQLFKFAAGRNYSDRLGTISLG